MLGRGRIPAKVIESLKFGKTTRQHMQTKVFFENSKGNKLCGMLSAPTAEKDIPVVILCHGLNSEKDSNTNLALNAILEKNSIASFRFDFFAHKESEGDIKDRTVSEFADDILNAISYLKAEGYRRFGIVGASFGGIAAVIAASKSSDLAFMVLKSPGMGKISRNMPNYKKDFDEGTWFTASKVVHIPTLIVHGSADQDVEVELGKRLAESIKDCRLEIIEGADHRYTKKEDFEKMIGLISRFVVENASKTRTKARQS